MIYMKESLNHNKHREKQHVIDPATEQWHPDENIAEKLKDAPRYESLRNKLFEQYMKQHIVGLFFEEARDVGFRDDQIEEIQNSLSKHDDSEILGALSLPHELREKWLSRAFESIEADKNTPVLCIEQLVSLGKKFGFTIGYHTSPQDIRPKDNGEWVIRGTEHDHRDNDIAMAYYSNKYRHLFKLKSPQYIYVVRAERDHRSDGNWNRAPSLSVIMRLPFVQVHEYVERAAQKIEKEDDKQVDINADT